MKFEVENINSKDNGSCYIATYVHGDYDASEVLILRKFRDEKLLTNSIGIVFVKFYYKVSPFLIKHFGGKIFRKTTKKVLDYIIKKSIKIVYLLEYRRIIKGGLLMLNV